MGRKWQAKECGRRDSTVVMWKSFPGRYFINFLIAVQVLMYNDDEHGDENEHGKINF